MSTKLKKIRALLYLNVEIFLKVSTDLTANIESTCLISGCADFDTGSFNFVWHHFFVISCGSISLSFDMVLFLGHFIWHHFFVIWHGSVSWVISHGTISWSFHMAPFLGHFMWHHFLVISHSSTISWSFHVASYLGHFTWYQFFVISLQPDITLMADWELETTYLLYHFFVLSPGGQVSVHALFIITSTHIPVMVQKCLVMQGCYFSTGICIGCEMYEVDSLLTVGLKYFGVLLQQLVV